MLDSVNYHGELTGTGTIDPDLIQLLLNKGPVVGPLLLIAYYLYRKADKATERLIMELKEEIERITQSRNRLEKILLKNRLSSSDSIEEDD